MLCNSDQNFDPVLGSSITNQEFENPLPKILVGLRILQGILKSFALPTKELETALDEGMGFDGSSIMGYTPIHESDMIAKPDPTTFQILNWRPDQGGAVARMFCDILEPGGKSYPGDPRGALKRILKKAADLGLRIIRGEV